MAEISFIFMIKLYQEHKPEGGKDVPEEWLKYDNEDLADTVDPIKEKFLDEVFGSVSKKSS